MSNVAHVEENLGIANFPPIQREQYQDYFRARA